MCPQLLWACPLPAGWARYQADLYKIRCGMRHLYGTF